MGTVETSEALTKTNDDMNSTQTKALLIVKFFHIFGHRVGLQNFVFHELKN